MCHRDWVCSPTSACVNSCLCQYSCVSCIVNVYSFFVCAWVACVCLCVCVYLCVFHPGRAERQLWAASHDNTAHSGNNEPAMMAGLNSRRRNAAASRWTDGQTERPGSLTAVLTCHPLQHSLLLDHYLLLSISLCRHIQLAQVWLSVWLECISSCIISQFISWRWGKK